MVSSGKVKKLLIALLIMCMSALLISSCGTSNDNTSAEEASSEAVEEKETLTFTNEEFASDFQAGLIARWAWQDTFDLQESVDSLSQFISKSNDKELESLEKYKDAEFEDGAFSEIVQKYITLLEGQNEMAVSGKYDFWTLYYNYHVYQWERQNLVKSINEFCTFDFSGADLDSYNELLSADMFGIDSFELIDNAITISDYSYEQNLDMNLVKVKVENHTIFDFPSFDILYRIKSPDGTIKSSEEYAMISNFPANSVAWSGEMWHDIEYGDTIEVYGYAASFQEGFMGNTNKFKEPFTFTVE